MQRRLWKNFLIFRSVQNQSNKKVAVRWIITLGLLISSMIVSSASLKKSSIEYKDKRFLYSFEAQINARHDKVLDKLHNFEQWDRLNDNISKSKVLETLSRNKIKRLLTLTQCIFTFCFNLKFYWDGFNFCNKHLWIHFI